VPRHGVALLDEAAIHPCVDPVFYLAQDRLVDTQEDWSRRYGQRQHCQRPHAWVLGEAERPAKRATIEDDILVTHDARQNKRHVLQTKDDPLGDALCGDAELADGAFVCAQHKACAVI
jgi:hypothetical protein